MKNNYPKPIIIMHWITFALVAMVYLTAGDPTITDWKGQIHVAGGILIFILFFLRLSFVFLYRKSIPKTEIINSYQIMFFKTVRFFLYLSLCIVPIAGWMTLSSFTDNFHVLSLNLPLLSTVWGSDYIADAHQFLGNLFIALVGLHACAALVHHFIFKDNVLKSMLFKKMM